MANHWDLGDEGLRRILVFWREYGNVNGEPPIRFKLFKNDYQPQRGSDIPDYEEATFPGYEAQVADWSGWGEVTVDDHVASLPYTVFLEYQAADTGFTSQTIYGYWAVDTDGNYLWGESFASPQVVQPSALLKLKPVLKLQTLPNPITP